MNDRMHGGYVHHPTGVLVGFESGISLALGSFPTGVLVGFELLLALLKVEVLVDSLINPLKAQNTRNPSWLVVLTILKNISQLGVGIVISNIWRKMFETTVMALYQL